MGDFLLTQAPAASAVAGVAILHPVLVSVDLSPTIFQIADCLRKPLQRPDADRASIETGEQRTARLLPGECDDAVGEISAGIKHLRGRIRQRSDQAAPWD